MCDRHPFNDPDSPLVCIQQGEHRTHVYHSTLDHIGDDHEGGEQT